MRSQTNIDPNSCIQRGPLIAQAQTESMLLSSSTSVPGNSGVKKQKSNMVLLPGNGEGCAQVTSIPAWERGSVLTGPDGQMALGPCVLCRVGDMLFPPDGPPEGS